MCLGGGNSATKEAAKQEAARQQQIQDSTTKVNQIFDAPTREAGYTDFVGALRKLMTDNLNKGKAVNDRKLKFSLARGGLTGGSAAVSADRTLGEEYTQGLLTADRKAQAALADVRNQDEASRLQLTNLAQTGVDTGTAASQAASAIRANLGKATADATQSSLWNAFEGTAKAWQTGQEQAEKRRSLLTPVGGLYS
jgi:hypothetical protein